MDVDAFRRVLPRLLVDRGDRLLRLALTCDHWCQQQRHDGVYCFRCGVKLQDTGTAPR